MNILLTLITLASSLLYVETGKVTYYNPGVMEAVYKNRINWNHVKPCQECIGMLAVKDCRQLGAKAYLNNIRGLDSETIGPFLIVDCSNRSHLADHIKNNLVAEVDYQTSRALHMDGPLYNVNLYIVQP